MPVLRGIDVKLVTFPAKQIIPEYPHPDSSSIRLVGKPHAASVFTERPSTASPSAFSSGPAVPSGKVDPKSSVYIATQPGTQFIIAYDIKKVPERCKYMNFKVFINGRHIVTCGRDLNERHRGVISRTLWAPSDTLGEWAGIEGRQFMFLREEGSKTAAEDGGLIEVQVYRAEARILLAPALREFQQGRQYGIVTPSTGLIDKPEEVDYHKYKLIDPIDTPYVRFHFHYRSFESLKDLNLIPEESVIETKHSHGAEPPQSSWPATEQASRASSKLLSDEESEKIRQFPRAADEKEFRVLPKQKSSTQAADAPKSTSPETSFLWLDGAADDAEDRPVVKPTPDRRDWQHQTRNTRPATRDAQHCRRQNVTTRVQPGRIVAPSPALQRPLPDLPIEPVAHTRTTSKSPAPSLSPSLKRSVDDGCFDDNVEIAESKVVRYSRILEKPTLLDVSPARDPESSLARPPTHRKVNRSTSGTSRHSHQPTATAAVSGHDSDSSSSASSWSGTQALEHPTALAPRPQLSYAQRGAQEQNQRLNSNHRVEHVSRFKGHYDAAEAVNGVAGSKQRRCRPQPLSVTVPTYRGTDTTMQAQVQRSPQPESGTDLQPSPEPSPMPQRPSTYSPLRDLGTQMLSGATFRRSGQIRTPTHRGSRRQTQVLSPTRPDPVRNSAGPTTTPARIALAEQRWSPRNAPTEPRDGVTFEEVMRQSPRHDPLIERMIDQLTRSDSFKENWPPS